MHREGQKGDIRILDHRGKPLPRPVTLRDRLKAVSKRTWKIVCGIVGFVVAAVAFGANLSTMGIDIPFTSKSTSVPPIVVKLVNNGAQSVSVQPRGDFLLWLPGAGGRHYEGKYEFHEPGGKTRTDTSISVAPGTSVTVFAQVLNEPVFGRILEQSDYDITLQVRRADGTLVHAEDLPFSRDAIRTYFVSANVSAKHSN